MNNELLLKSLKNGDFEVIRRVLPITISRHVSQTLAKIRWKISSSCLPTVYAADDSAAALHNIAGVEPSNTTIDQLTTARPKVLVTEDEVKTFIQNERGRDRVAAMFVKE
jgi:hypothetical protein